MSYQLVKAGELPPLDQRVPPPDDRAILQGPGGIGEYGGTWRQTAIASWVGEFIMAQWARRDADGVLQFPWIGKKWDMNDDGTVYTFTMREGAYWSDGQPFTMEDIRFAWQDHNFNKQVFPAIPLDWRDPVTDNPVEFAVVDDLHFTLTSDTPNWPLMETRVVNRWWCAKGLWAWFCPPYMKDFHVKYADPANLQAMISEANLEDWTQLFSQKGNVFANSDLPVMTAWGVCQKEETLVRNCRNHYFVVFDPEGNQLPYADEASIFTMESREIAIFRAMNGEHDARSDYFYPHEMPLYNSNMEKGDYSIFHWPSPGGADAAIKINGQFNDDPEVGTLLRTKNFRIALSLGLDREVLNESLYLGSGIVQNWVPHPSTPYYPGDAIAQLNIEHDVDRANTMLDAILPDKDADGFRLRTDNGERLVINAAYPFNDQTQKINIFELIAPMWAEIGIELEYSVVQSVAALIRSGEATLSSAGTMGHYTANPWIGTGGSLQCQSGGCSFASDVGLWAETKGEKGMAIGPDSSYLPLAPADTYPVDVSGNIKRAQEIFNEGRAYSRFHPRRIEIGKELFTLNAEEMYVIPIAAFSGQFRGVMLNRNNFRGVPRQHFPDATGYYPETYWFEDGMDNLHHPDNKSKVTKSFSYLGGE